MRLQRLLPAIALVLAASAADRVDLVEFFGYKGIDVEAVRRALPVQDGGVYNEKVDRAISEAVKRVTGGEATDIAPICCNERGNWVLFIGLPGKSSRAFPLNAKPNGTVRLPPEFLTLYAKLVQARGAAIKKGGDSPVEDDSQGYVLIHYPPARKLELELRDYALAYDAIFYDVLENCSDSQQRSQAAVAIGYAQRSARQLAALVRASHDSNAGVRDESTRALGVLLHADPSLAAQVPAGDFIEMVASGNWMDRNKASWVLEALTRSRDPQLLARIESVWEPLLEMALWRDTGRAAFARFVLGRIRGLAEDQVMRFGTSSPAAFSEAIGR